MSCDYPEFAHALARGIESGEVYPGIGICGSGEGFAMTMNKHQQIRAALCWSPEIAHMSRQHNDANALVMPGRYIDNNTARKIMDEFFATTFEEGRHLRRIRQIPLSEYVLCTTPNNRWMPRGASTFCLCGHSEYVCAGVIQWESHIGCRSPSHISVRKRGGSQDAPLGLRYPLAYA